MFKQQTFSYLKPYLLLLVILGLAYLPVATFHFGLKNDAFSDNFPNKFFFTEAIHSGYLPLWNPYLNYGFPIYADPGFAFWSPITWLFGSIIGYNAYTLTLEVLLYIYIAGVTMYNLARHLKLDTIVAVAVAAMYMCSGFFVGEIQHINFLTAAAFLPFLVQQFLSTCDNPNHKSACKTAIAYYLVFTGGHPAIPVAVLYFLFCFFVFHLIFNPTTRKNIKPLLKYHALAIVLFVILYSPALYSYATVLHDYGRSTPVNQFDLSATITGFSFSSYISFLSPFVTTVKSSFFADDLSMRNIYFSIAGFILLLTQIRSKNPLVRSFFVTAAIMLWLSYGGSIKSTLYSNLPLLKYIRTNGEVRVLSILCFCLIAGYELNTLKSKNTSWTSFKRIAIIILVSSLALLVFSLLHGFGHFSHLLSSTTFSSQGIKSLIDNLHFNDVLIIGLAIQSVFLFVIVLVKPTIKHLAFIIVADLIINSIMYLPFSGVGTVTLPEIQQTYNQSPKGIIIPPLIKIKDLDTLSTKRTGLVGSLSFYNKHIGTATLTDYPSYFTSTKSYFESSLPATINNLPFVFLKKNIPSFESSDNFIDSAVIVTSFSPQKIQVSTNSSQPDTFVLLQNNYKFWKVFVDGNPTKISFSFITFMSISVPPGYHLVTFYYQDTWLLCFVILSIATFIILLIYLFSKRAVVTI